MEKKKKEEEIFFNREANAVTRWYETDFPAPSRVYILCTFAELS